MQMLLKTETLKNLKNISHSPSPEAEESAKLLAPNKSNAANINLLYILMIAVGLSFQ